MARRIDELPDVVAVPITVVALGITMAVLTALEALTESQRGIGQVVVFVVLVVAGQVTLFTERRRYGGRDQVRLLRRALRTGVVPSIADEERWRRSAHTWPDPDRLRGRARWTVATMVVAMVALFVWVGTDHPPQPATRVLVALAFISFAWSASTAFDVHRLEGAEAVRNQLLRS